MSRNVVLQSQVEEKFGYKRFIKMKKAMGFEVIIISFPLEAASSSKKENKKRKQFLTARGLIGHSRESQRHRGECGLCG